MNVKCVKREEVGGQTQETHGLIGATVFGEAHALRPCRHACLLQASPSCIRLINPRPERARSRTLCSAAGLCPIQTERARRPKVVIDYMHLTALTRTLLYSIRILSHTYSTYAS